MKYVIIIPAKDEEEDLPKTLESVCSQTYPPELAIIVDDGSTDKTPQIIKEYAQKFPFVKHLVRNDPDKTYYLGGKVVEVFTYGKNYLDELDVSYDFVLKMDADVVFDKELFEQLSERIDRNDKIGIASCTPYYEDSDGNRVFDSSPAWHTNGQFKIYRKECLEQIGGLVKDLGWDCADNVHAIEKGWETVVYKDLYYRLTRPIGRFSVKKGTVRQGIGAYKLRHSFIYIMLKVLHDSLRKPYFLLGIYYLQGYFRGVRKYKTRTLNKQQGKLLRKLLWSSFFERFRNKEFILQQKK